MKFVKSNFAKKLIIVLVILMVFNIAIPKKVHAAWNFSGIIMKPITTFLLSFLVTIDVTLGFWLNMINVQNSGIGSYVEDVTSKSKDTDDWTTAAADGVNYALSLIFVGPDTIFSGKLKMLNANIFNANLIDLFSTETDTILGRVADDAGESISNTMDTVWHGGNITGTLKRGISTTYVILRNICATLMLAGLIFTGIRILVTSNTPNKSAQWRQYAFDWLVGMILLIFSHVIMYGIFYISDLLTAALGSSLMGFGGLNFQLIKTCLMSFDSATQVVTIMMLGYLIYLTVVFAISYFKRLIWICVLIVISPIVSIMYAFGNQTKQIYSKWLREYIMMVLIQPFHIIVYYTLVSVPLNMLPGNTAAGSLEYSSFDLFTEIYALAAMSMIKPAERYIMALFGFNQGLAKMASADEGKKSLNNTIKIVGTAAAGVATAGLGTAAMSALKGGQLISSFSKATKTALGNGKVGQFLGKGVDKAAEGATKINDKIFKNNQKSDAIDSGVATSRYPRQIPDKVEETPKENKTENQNEENNLLSSETNNTSQKQTTNTGDITQQDMVGNNNENVQEGIRLIESDDEQDQEQSNVVENELDNNSETKNDSQENNDKNNIVNASNITVNAGTVNMQGERNSGIPNEIQQNDQGIKTVDTQDDNQVDDDSELNIEASIDDNTTTNENTEKVSDKNIDTQENSKWQSNIGIPDEIQQNNQGIKTVDTQDDNQENYDSESNIEKSTDTNTTTNENTEKASDKNIDSQENFKGQNNINANNIIINAGNVNMQTQNGNGVQDSIKQKATDDEELEDTEGEDEEKKKTSESTDKDKNNDDVVLHEGEDEKKKKSLKDMAIDAIEGGNDRTLNFMKLATGQQGVFETLDNINPNSRLGKVTSELLDNDLGKALKQFENNVDVAELHKNFNELRDSFDPNANGDWKPTNERLQANQKEKIEDRKYKFVHNEGNKNIMFKIMKEKHFERLKRENPNKNDEWVNGKCMELAKSELKSLSEIYAPLGVLDVQMAHDCEEDRVKYGISTPQEAVLQRMEFETKFNQDSNVLIKLEKAVGEKPTSVTEKIGDARTYYQEGYRNVDDMAWMDWMKGALKRDDSVYVMQVDKELRKKGGNIEYKGKDPAMEKTVKQINEHYRTGSIE